MVPFSPNAPWSARNVTSDCLHMPVTPSATGEVRLLFCTISASRSGCVCPTVGMGDGSVVKCPSPPRYRSTRATSWPRLRSAFAISAPDTSDTSRSGLSYFHAVFSPLVKRVGFLLIYSYVPLWFIIPHYCVVGKGFLCMG